MPPHDKLGPKSKSATGQRDRRTAKSWIAAWIKGWEAGLLTRTATLQNVNDRCLHKPACYDMSQVSTLEQPRVAAMETIGTFFLVPV